MLRKCLTEHSLDGNESLDSTFHGISDYSSSEETDYEYEKSPQNTHIKSLNINQSLCEHCSHAFFSCNNEDKFCTKDCRTSYLFSGRRIMKSPVSKYHQKHGNNNNNSPLNDNDIDSSHNNNISDNYDFNCNNNKSNNNYYAETRVF